MYQLMFQTKTKKVFFKSFKSEASMKRAYEAWRSKGGYVSVVKNSEYEKRLLIDQKKIMLNLNL